MCGYIGNVIDSPLTQKLMDALGVGSHLDLLQNNPGSGPGALLDIIVQGEKGIEVLPAVWWLLLQSTEPGVFKPSKYTSFNTRSDKLNIKNSAGYIPYRQSRCIVPATYIIEGDGAKQNRCYHRIAPTNQAFALGGLYKAWRNQSTGDVTHSFSVVTLPVHPRWQQVHSKSTPLFLPMAKREIVARWLDPKFTAVEFFESLMVPCLYDDIECTPIRRPGDQSVIGTAFTL